MTTPWTETVHAHRRTTREAILEAAGTLVVERGLASVTMSAIADRAGIGRATLYKHFHDLDTVLAAWHERHVAGHLEILVRLGEAQPGPPRERLRGVLHAYALMTYHRRHVGAELTALLHQGEEVARTRQRVYDLVRDLLIEAADEGAIRADVGPDELARYCVHALAAARDVASEAAVERLVSVTLDGVSGAMR